MIDLLQRELEKELRELSLIKANTENDYLEVRKQAHICESYQVVIDELKKKDRSFEDMDLMGGEEIDIELPPYSELLRIEVNDASVNPCSRGKKIAFRMILPTCPHVDEITCRTMHEMMELLEIKPEDAAGIDSIFCRMRQQIKSRATEPLRRALAWACHQLPSNKTN